MTAIVDVHARQILDSRGNPTVEVDVTLEDGSMGRAAVPSGASTGAHEAVELRDGDKSRWGGKGVTKAVAGGERRDCQGGDRPRRRRPGRARRGDDRARRDREQRPLGRQCDPRRQPRGGQGRGESLGLPLYRYIGGAEANLLPVPMMNILNGGVHADNGIDFQEFMVMPVGAPTLRRGAALRGGDFPCAEERASPGGLLDRGRRRGRLCARPHSRRARRSISFCARSRPRATSRGRRAAGDGPGGERVLQERPLRAEGRGQEPRPAGDGRLLRRACVELPDRVDRGRHGRGRCGGMEGRDRQARPTSPAGRRRRVRHQRQAAAVGYRPRDRQFDPDQGQPDRHADRDHRRRPARADATATRRSCRTARARPRIRPSPTSRSP